MADSRGVAVWREHWECIERSEYLAVYLVNDEGKSMSGAQKEPLSDVVRQSDTFHGFAHRLGLWVDRLERTAYAAIEHEDDRAARLRSAKYDRFHYLYLCLISTLQVFDLDGKPNERKAAETTTRREVRKNWNSWRMSSAMVENINSILRMYLNTQEIT